MALLGHVSACGPSSDDDPMLDSIAVFSAGDAGRHTYRIPAIARSSDGTLLAFAEGRRNDASDHGDIDLVVRRSFDDGATWTPIDTVFDAGSDLAGNPAPVVDERTGRILVFFVRAPGDRTEAQVREGVADARRTAWLTTSDDEGRTWSAPRDITDDASRASWRWLAFGPGHGIQLRAATHRGRIVIASNHSTDEGPEDRWLGAHLVYTDDAGDTVHVGAVDDPGTGIINPNETAVVERADGSILAISRDQHGSSASTRARAVSRDGGESFESTFAEVPTLPGPVVQGSIARRSDGRLVYCGPSDPRSRRRLALSTSDDGLAWTEAAIVYSGPSAYSDLAVLDDTTLGVLYEAGRSRPYDGIWFRPMTLE